MDPAQQQAVFEQITQGDYMALYKSYLEQAPATFATLKLPARLLPTRGQPGLPGELLHNQAYSGRISSAAGFPVRKFKYVLLKHLLPTSAFFYTSDYDINLLSPQVNPIEQQFMRRFLNEKIQVLLTIQIPFSPELNHAIAGVLTPDGNLFIINTQPTDMIYLSEIKLLVDGMLGASVNVVDVAANLGINLQANADEVFCVTWALLALVQLGSQQVTLPVAQQYLKDVAMFKTQDPPTDQNKFIMEILEDFKNKYNSSGGKRKMRRKTSKKWIQDVVSHMKKGAFTRQALQHHETPEEYAEDVLKHPKKHKLRTRRRAQFLLNIRKTKKSSHSRK